MWSMRLCTKIMEKYINLPLIMKMVSNGGLLCNKVHTLTTYGDNSFAFSDTGDSCIKAYNFTVKQRSVIVSNGKSTRNGSKAQFSQPTGICFDYDTVYRRHLDRSPSYDKQSITSLIDYLKHRHLFGDVWTSHKEKYLGHSRDPPGNRETRASFFL